MSDPLSVTSGAAGIVSLGITVCQGLVSYYQAWESWEDDVKSAIRDVEGVSNYLYLVNSRIGKLSPEQADTVKQAQAETRRIGRGCQQTQGDTR